MMQATTSMRNLAGCNSTTLSTVPGVEIELPLKCLINFFEGPRDKASVAFGRLFFRGFGSVYILDPMAPLVMITSHLLKLNVLFCHIHSFFNLSGTSLQFGRAAGDKWVM